MLSTFRKFQREEISDSSKAHLIYSTRSNPRNPSYPPLLCLPHHQLIHTCSLSKGVSLNEKTHDLRPLQTHDSIHPHSRSPTHSTRECFHGFTTFFQQVQETVAADLKLCLSEEDRAPMNLKMEKGIGGISERCGFGLEYFKELFVKNGTNKGYHVIEQ